MNDVPKQDVMIFAEALDLPLSERAAHLDRACAGDQKLRQRVEGLLLTHDQAGGFLERPPAEMAIASRLGADLGRNLARPGKRCRRKKGEKAKGRRGEKGEGSALRASPAVVSYSTISPTEGLTFFALSPFRPFA